MSKKKEDIPKSERSEIVNNILGAKDRKEQLKIEAGLHLTSVTTIKEILKDYGVTLKIFNGGSRKKKHIEDVLAEEQEIITPVEEIETVEEQAEHDIIIPAEEIEAVEEQVEAAEEQVKASAAETQRGECVSTDDVLFVGLQILEEAAVFDAIKEKINKLIARRRGLVAELGHLDVLLKKYAFFYEDIYQDMQEEGIEI